MIPAAIREEQACACLEAAEYYQEPLLALAVKLAGNREDGMDLFQQVVLNCHDAIQRNGFAGDKYQFYLRTALHNHYKRQKQRGWREVPVDFQQVPTGSADRNDEHEVPWAAKGFQTAEHLRAALAAEQTPADSHDYLAAQVQEEITRVFNFTDRVLWRLHVDGLPAREIAAHLQKGDHTSVWRRLDKMKDYLRATFQQAWDAIHE
jgi:DNA-directed RNA polymerase specialized sigma24 family protein